MSTSAAKRIAGEAATALVTDGMRVGLGTGSTTAFALKALGRRIQEDGLSIVGTPTSFAAEQLARQVGIPLVTLDEVEALDIALDGADEIDPALNLIKGRGGAHTREKVVASLAQRFVVLADPSKQVEQLGTKSPLPVEVVPMAAAPVMRALEHLGATPNLRMGQQKDGPIITDQGLWIIDARFEGIADAKALNHQIHAIPGVLDHGLFLNLATDVLIGFANGKIQHVQRIRDGQGS